MNPSLTVRFLGAALFTLVLLLPAPSRADDQDMLWGLTSVEWGNPDRWSFTSRYFHQFCAGPSCNDGRWLNNLTVTLSPGTAGGRLGGGYLCSFQTKGMAERMFGKARAVLLRTWGHPLKTHADRTFVGAEMRITYCFVNAGSGYYRQVSSSDGVRDSFWGYHVGLGI